MLDSLSPPNSATVRPDERVLSSKRRRNRNLIVSSVSMCNGDENSLDLGGSDHAAS